MDIKDILIVENDRQLTDMFKAFFNRMSYKLDVVESAEEALDLLKKYRYKIMFVDINLGEGMNGVDFCIEVRKNNNYSKIYAMTALRPLFEEISPQVAGFTDAFYKPVPYDTMLKRLEEDLEELKDLD